jgi:uncharacterized membrane protein
MTEFFEPLLPRFSASLLPVPVALGMAGLITAITLWTYYGSRRWTQAVVYAGVAAYVFGILWHFIVAPALEGGLSSLPFSRFFAGLLTLPGLLLIFLVERNRHYQGVTEAQGVRTWILLAVRLGALLCALFVVLSPTWAYKEIDPTPSRVVILIDASRSMETQDEAPRHTRWEAAMRDLEEAKATITELQEKYNVTVIIRSFDSRLQAFTEKTLPAGEATAVYRALEDAYAEGREGLRPGERLQGIILMSDGRDNVGQPLRDPVINKFRRGACPVHSIGYGQPGGSELQQDLVMAYIDAPSTARVKDRLVVRGVLQAQRFQNRRIDVWLYLDDKPAMENAHGGLEGKPVKITIEPKSVSENIPFEMPAFRLPDAAGDYRLMLKAVPPPGEKELTDQNNIVSTYISLTKEGLSVMYFDKRRYESRFLSEALKNDERISVFRAYLAEDGGADAEKWRQQVRETLLKSDIDVFIIGDIPASRFGNSTAPDSILNIIYQKVQVGGKGLLMIGGHESFANGGWDKTPLAIPAGGRQVPTFTELLPVEMDERGMLEPQGVQREVKFMPRDQILQEETALGQFALRLDSDQRQNKEWWASLPPLSGGNRLGRRRGDATVLVELPDQADPHILLAVQKSGKGRGAALAVDTTWQWFRGGTPRRKEDEGKEMALSAAREAHLRFWRQLILWLAQQDATGSAIRLELAQRRLAFGKEQTITMQAREVTPGGAKDLQKPLKGAAFEVKVFRVDPASGKPDPKSEMNVDAITPLSGEDAKSQALFSKVPDSGEYLVQVKARHQGKDLGVATARFMVYRDDTELLNRSANHADLEAIATRTAGSFQLHGGLNNVLQKMREEHVTKVTRLVKYPDWDEPSYPLQTTVFMLFVICLSVEWVLRRMWGLV